MARKDKDKEQEEDMPVRGKRPTQEDLVKAAEAAREAAQAAGDAANVVAQGLAEETGGGEVTPISRPRRASQQPTATIPQQAQGRGGRGQQVGPPAFEAFMAALDGAIRRAGSNVSVEENAGWVKIESAKNGHKIYIAKTKTTVNRIESTLPAERVRGSEGVEPGTNGRIASVLPADPQVVSQAIDLLARLDEQIPPPRRGQRGGNGD